MVKQSRRRVLQTSAGIGLVGMAGCMGGNGDDVERLIVGTPAEGTGSYDASQAVQRVLREESDIVEFDTQTTGGDPASIREWNQGQIDVLTTANNQVEEAMDGRGPFEEDEEDLTMPYQGLSFQTREDYFMAVEGSGIETTDDMLERDVWLLPPAWGSRDLLERIFQEYDEELYEDLFENAVDLDTGDLAGGIEEGQVEAFNAYGESGQRLPSWLQEVDARSDVYHIELTDPFAEAFQQGPTEYIEDVEMYGWDQDVGTDSFNGHMNPLNFYFDPEISDDAVYEVLRVCYEAFDRIEEAYPSMLNYQEDIHNMTVGISEDLRAVHPGAQRFYEENDLWEDSWPEAE